MINSKRANKHKLKLGVQTMSEEAKDKDRVLFFWAPSTTSRLPKNHPFWDAERVIEVPDDISTDIVDDVAKRVTQIVREESIQAKSDGVRLRIIQLGPGALTGVLDHVLTMVIVNSGGELTTIKSRKKNPDAASVVIAMDAAENVVVGNPFLNIDFTKPEMEDKRLYDDDIPATSTPPEEFIDKYGEK
jgi:hypothetical protein